MVKFDLLGLGMLGALHDAFDLVREHHGVEITLGTVPPEDPAVYDMLCDADPVGLFQVESREQASTLPRLEPRKFYDLVIEVALIRPGPIQGGAVPGQPAQVELATHAINRAAAAGFHRYLSLLAPARNANEAQA